MGGCLVCLGKLTCLWVVLCVVGYWHGTVLGSCASAWDMEVCVLGIWMPVVTGVCECVHVCPALWLPRLGFPGHREGVVC